MAVGAELGCSLGTPERGSIQGSLGGTGCKAQSPPLGRAVPSTPLPLLGRGLAPTVCLCVWPHSEFLQYFSISLCLTQPHSLSWLAAEYAGLHDYNGTKTLLKNFLSNALQRPALG